MRVLVAFGRPCDYDPTIHKETVNKFLMWDQLIIVGPQMKHKWLYDSYRLLCEPGTLLLPDALIAAGDCADGMVMFWSSGDFRINTPEHLKPIIKRALGMMD